jgi:septal ring factor EnvC (AmiA/AmiB activator)
LETDLRALNAAQILQQHALEEGQRGLEEVQRALEEAQRAQARTAAAQQEFLIQEQQVIVETQKVVLGELQTQLDQLIEQQRQKNSELVAQVSNLKALIGATGPRGAGRVAGKRIAPKPEQA